MALIALSHLTALSTDLIAFSPVVLPAIPAINSLPLFPASSDHQFNSATAVGSFVADFDSDLTIATSPPLLHNSPAFDAIDRLFLPLGTSPPW